MSNKGPGIVVCEWCSASPRCMRGIGCNVRPQSVSRYSHKWPVRMEYLYRDHWYTANELSEQSGILLEVVLERLKAKWRIEDVVGRRVFTRQEKQGKK